MDQGKWLRGKIKTPKNEKQLIGITVLRFGFYVCMLFGLSKSQQKNME